MKLGLVISRGCEKLRVMLRIFARALRKLMEFYVWNGYFFLWKEE